MDPKHGLYLQVVMLSGSPLGTECPIISSCRLPWAVFWICRVKHIEGLGQNLDWSKVYYTMAFGHYFPEVRTCRQITMHSSIFLCFSEGRSRIDSATWASAYVLRSADVRTIKTLDLKMGEIRSPCCF